jgi:hypothetical protein
MVSELMRFNINSYKKAADKYWPIFDLSAMLRRGNFSIL